MQDSTCAFCFGLPPFFVVDAVSLAAVVLRRHASPPCATGACMPFAKGMKACELSFAVVARST